MENKNCSAIIAGPNIVSMEGGSLQDFKDFTDCTLVSSLNADIVANRFTQSEEWFNSYGSCLDWVGWEPVEDLYTMCRDDVSGNVAETYLKSLSLRQNSRLGSSVINLLIDSFDAIKNDAPATYSLDKETAQGELFQVTPFWRDRSGKLRMQVSRLKLVMNVHSENFLFSEAHHRSAHLRQYYAEFVLNESRLKETRLLIKKKLQDYRLARFTLGLSASRG
ncbi:MAG: hypothetical protein JWP42_1875 [Pseudomonas sp.]|nr:hypothetical protein [Pseudomonas sp.]